MNTTFTVYFEDPFWVGMIQRFDGNRLSVCKVTFGAEPTDAEIYAFLLKHFNDLQFTKPIKAEEKKRADSPKRRMRNAKKMLDQKGVGTKSQQALKKQYEESKAERKAVSKEKREEDARRLFELKQKKKKEKHRGH